MQLQLSQLLYEKWSEVRYSSTSCRMESHVVQLQVSQLLSKIELYVIKLQLSFCMKKEVLEIVR